MHREDAVGVADRPQVVRDHERRPPRGGGIVAEGHLPELAVSGDSVPDSIERRQVGPDRLAGDDDRATGARFTASVDQCGRREPGEWRRYADAWQAASAEWIGDLVFVLEHGRVGV